MKPAFLKYRFAFQCRRLLVLVALFFLASSFLAGAAAGSETAASPLRSAAEIEYPPFSIVDGEGRASGFSVELLRAALSAMGREVTFRTGPWAEVKGWLGKGEIDALPLVGRTPEREPLFDFTFPYMTLHGAIVVRKDTSDIWDLEDLAGRKVAVKKGDNAEEFLRREDRGIDVRTTPTFEDALHELSAGRHDAVFIQRLVALRLIQESGLTNLKVINNPVDEFRQDFCFAVTEGDRNTLALLNEGLSIVMADGTSRHLHAKWFASLELPTHRKIVVGGDYSYPPFEYLNEKGRPDGFTVEITRAVAQEMGLDIEIRLGPWAEIVKALENGEIDVVQGMFYSPKRDLKFDFTQPYEANHYVFAVHKEQGPPPNRIMALADKRIVVQRGGITKDFLAESGLKERVTEVATQEDVLRAVAEGKYDCGLVVRVSAMYLIEKNGWSDLILGRHPIYSTEYCYAVLNGRKALLAEFSEGLKVLEKTGEHRRIQKKWLGSYEKLAPSITDVLLYAGLIVGSLLLLLFMFFLWWWSLRKQVAQKTQELKESADRFRFVFEAANVGKSITLPTGELDANEAFAEFLGYTRSELNQKRWQDITLPEDIPLTEKAIAPLLAGEKDAARFEKRYVHKSGDLRWADVSLMIRRDADGKPLYIVATVADISERKQAEEALRESEEKYRLLAEHSEDIIFTLDTELKYTYISPSVKSLRGYAPAELMGKPINESLSPGSLSLAAKTFSEELKAAKESGPGSRTARILELQMNCKDGSRIWVEVKASFLRDRDGNITGILGVTRDISSRKKAEQALRESEERLQAILGSNANPIVVYDSEGVPEYLNPAFVKVFGWTREELKGRRIPFVPEDQKEITAAKIGEIYATGEPVKFASRRLTKPGETLDVIVSAAIVKGTEGQGIGMVVNLTDITEQRKLEIQLRQAQKLESVGRLAGGVAHDYNNMLSVILGYTEMALDQVSPDDPLHEDLTEVLAAARRSADITRQLLAFSRQQTVSPKVLDINGTIEDMLKMLRRLIGEDIDLFWKPGKKTWPVYMDPAQLDQILANLCVNARDAIGGVGKLAIETGTAVFDDAYCAVNSGFTPGEYTMLAVSDDGRGMEKETLANLFEPFFTTKQRGEGTGLGLATVYGIVKQNNGFIDVSSEPGVGTTFRIYLPRHAAGKDDKAEQSALEELAGRGETILLVEDEPSILRISQKMLKNLGYEVIAAKSPIDALTLVEAYGGEIHLLITDVVMPEMNGRDLAGRMQALYPKLKILFMSGYTADVIAHRRILEDGVHFLQKPFTKQALAAKIREALAG